MVVAGRVTPVLHVVFFVIAFLRAFTGDVAFSLFGRDIIDEATF